MILYSDGDRKAARLKHIGGGSIILNLTEGWPEHFHLSERPQLLGDRLLESEILAKKLERWESETEADRIVVTLD